MNNKPSFFLSKPLDISFKNLDDLTCIFPCWGGILFHDQLIRKELTLCISLRCLTKDMNLSFELQYFSVKRKCIYVVYISDHPPCMLLIERVVALELLKNHPIVGTWSPFSDNSGTFLCCTYSDKALFLYQFFAFYLETAALSPVTQDVIKWSKWSRVFW